MRLGFLLGLLALIIFLAFTSIVLKNNLANILASFGRWNFCSRTADLQLENEVLKAQIWDLTDRVKIEKGKYLVGRIHSSYPFNNKDLLSVDIGENQGVKKFMPATIGGHLLVGQVINVFKNYSLVRTIFSPDWELPVRIGEQKVPALLIGGPNLKLEMISNDQKVNEKEAVFAASKDLPFGLKIGELINTQSDSATGVFKEANVKLGYDINTLTQLDLMPWTPD